MIKKNKWSILLTSIIILLPALFGLAFWNDLPEQMTTHWGADGTADGWSGRAFAVFALPLLILAVHWICIFCTMKDPKNKGQNGKVFGLILWITPLISVFANGLIYAVSLGKEVHPYLITTLLMGIVFVAIGNYLPKCKQNYTIGIKVKWTLENEENWNATHRISGKIWVVGGLLLIVGAFLPQAIIPLVMVCSIVLLVVFPVIYSYFYHRKQMREGTYVITPQLKSRVNKTITIISQVAVVLILAFIGILMFTGDIDINCGKKSFVVEASYWKDLTVEYAAVETVEYRETDDRGVRTYGFSSARLLSGMFQNEEFGNYTRYSYTRCDACVVLTVNGKTLVINGPDEQSTKAIYEEIRSNLG